MSKPLLWSSASGCLWIGVAISVAYAVSPIQSTLLDAALTFAGGIVASPAIGALVGYIARRFNRLNFDGRLLVALGDLYFATYLFLLATGMGQVFAQLLKGRGVDLQGLLVVGPILETHRRDDRWLIRKVWDSGLKTLGMIIGPSHVAAKLITVALLGIAFYLSRATGTYRITADTVLEPAAQLSVATAFDGYIRTARVRAGDIVHIGDELATLDDREYQLERTRWQSQEDQSQRQYHEALGNGNASQVQIFAAQVAQARAQVALLDEQISRTRIKSPFDGVIVTGDLSQSLGVPVQRGQVLFQIAPLDSYRVILQVDERDIAGVNLDQRGQLVLSGSPNDPLAFKIHRITPVSTTNEGRNFFRVEAELDGAPARLKPGMEGVGKIEVDTRLLVWIWTHQATDWLKLKIWNWLP